ncbi:cell wall-binding repeat-containing protein [Desulfitobacterium sp. AusDCA]|uniref:cell wall-binding repeat-containing protein n=1 Tax=Desulfitobacterium sp. AusDCA TaxID=3240383 RepID=UPI003DA6D220
MKRKFKVLVSLICTVSLFFSFSLAAQAKPDKPEVRPGKSESHRFCGEDRFGTSTSVADMLDAGQQVQNIVLASAHNFPDALSASTLAYQLKAPIILVSPGYKDSMMSYNYVKEHLVAGGTVTIVGGNGIISHSAEQWLLNNGFHVNRLGGKDRFETNALIVKQLNVAKGTPVIIASGLDFPDALGISSLAASKGWPILLSNPSNLTQSVQDFLTGDQPTDVYIVGGCGVLQNGLFNQIKALSPNSQIQRFGGSDRFETLAQILNKFYPNPAQIFVANGFDFADALSGSTLAAAQNAPILLVNPRSKDLPKSIEAYLEILKNNNVQPQVNVLGGEGAVPQRLIDKINEILQSTGETTTTSSSITVSNPSTTGFTVNLDPAVKDLGVNNFSLVDTTGSAITISSAVPLDDGKEYALSAALTAGQSYTLTVVKEGYTFGSARNVIIPTAPTISSAVITNGNSIVLTMSSALTGSLADPLAFKITGAASAPTVTSAAVSGTKVILTLSSAIANTDSNVLVSYAKTGNNDLTNGAPVENSTVSAVNE